MSVPDRVAGLAVRVTVGEPQVIVPLATKLAIGTAVLDVTVAMATAEQLLADDTVTEYVPVVADMLAVVSPVFHKKIEPPEAVKVVDCPGHTVRLPVIVAVVDGQFTVMVNV